ncbi:hypothetical protein [Vibrio breoganii]|nr:hypothetical protein [Vibrio breoganii]
MTITVLYKLKAQLDGTELSDDVREEIKQLRKEVKRKQIVKL